MVDFRLERMDHDPAYAIARHHLDFVGRQLGRCIVLVRANQEECDELGLAQVSLTHLPGSDSLLAIDRKAPGRKAGLAVRQRRRLRAGVLCPCRDLVHMVGEDSSRTFLVERDHAQRGP